jgi:hypothetical protein
MMRTDSVARDTRYRTMLLVDQILADHAEAIIAAVIKKAEVGDRAAARLVARHNLMFRDR